MNHSTKLTDLLQPTFALNRARLACLAALVIALFKVKTVNLAQLATAFPGPADIDSHYLSLQRFFKHVQFQPARMAPFVLAFLPDAPYTLALDRTQWMLGKIPINCLVLSVVHDGIAFPLFWQFLAKRGNSNTQERIELLGQFLKGISNNTRLPLGSESLKHVNQKAGGVGHGSDGLFRCREALRRSGCQE